MSKRITFDDLKIIANFPGLPEDTKERAINSMKVSGYKLAVRDSGYTAGDIETFLMDSVQPAFCFYCGAEHDLEPDGEMDCEDCEHGHIKSLAMIYNLI